MDVIRKDLPHPSDYTRITVVSDAHLGCRACDVKSLKWLLKERSKLNNHRILLLGDTGDWIMPNDHKRYTNANSIKELAGSCDPVGDTIDYIAEIFWPYRDTIDVSLVGNHEASILKNGNTNVAKQLADRLGIPCGGMSCFLVYRWQRKTSEAAMGSATLLLHHGAWVAAASGDIPPAAVRWAKDFEDWDLFLFGHNHSLGASVRSPLRVPRIGSYASSRDQKIVACGNWRRNYMGGVAPGYEEIKGHRPAPIGAPLIEIRPHTCGGDRQWHAKKMSEGAPAERVEIRVIV